MFLFPDPGQIFTRQVALPCASIGVILLAQGFSRAVEITTRSRAVPDRVAARVCE
jgi:hypothetical protein